MSDNVVALTPKIPPVEEHKERIINTLKEFIKRTENGEVTGIVIVASNAQHFSRSSVNLAPFEQVAMLSRAMYNVHKDWDSLG